MAISPVILYVCIGLVTLTVITIFVFLLYKWKQKEKNLKNSFPSIILTSHDSPELKEKRLWSPTAVDSEGRVVKSYWFPSNDVKQFHTTTSEYQQRFFDKQSDEEVKGRLKFSFSYDYDPEKERSILVVKLHHGRDFVNGYDEMPMDTFVKTRLLPSNKRCFTSKMQRRTLNPNYNETYEFDVEYEKLRSQVLCFELYCYECLSSHKLFGEVIVPFKELGSSGSSNVIKEISMSVNISEPDTAEFLSNPIFGFPNNNAIIGNLKIEQVGNGLSDESPW